MSYEFYNPHVRQLNIGLPGGVHIRVMPNQAVPSPGQEADGITARALKDFVKSTLLHPTPAAMRRSLFPEGQEVPEPTIVVDRGRPSRIPPVETKKPRTLAEIEKALEEVTPRPKIIKGVPVPPTPKPVAQEPPVEASIEPATVPSGEVPAASPSPVEEAVSEPAVDPIELVRKLKREVEQAEAATAEKMQQTADTSCSSGVGKKGKRTEEP